MTNLDVATIPKHKIGKWTTLKSAIKTADFVRNQRFIQRVTSLFL